MLSENPKLFSQKILAEMRKAGRKLTYAALLYGVAGAVPSFAEQSHRPMNMNPSKYTNSDVACAVHTAYGEANGRPVEELATVVHTLVLGAQEHGRSLCAEAHARYKPKGLSSPDAVKAVQNVLFEGASLVPPELIQATEFRDCSEPLLSKRLYIDLGDIDSGCKRHGHGPLGNHYYMERPKDIAGRPSYEEKPVS